MHDGELSSANVRFPLLARCTSGVNAPQRQFLASTCTSNKSSPPTAWTTPTHKTHITTKHPHPRRKLTSIGVVHLHFRHSSSPESALSPPAHKALPPPPLLLASSSRYVNSPIRSQSFHYPTPCSSHIGHAKANNLTITLPPIISPIPALAR